MEWPANVVLLTNESLRQLCDALLHIALEAGSKPETERIEVGFACDFIKLNICMCFVFCPGCCVSSSSSRGF